jgi:hypothetical protein
MSLMSREFCCAGMVLRGGAGLRRRRHRWLYFGDEGLRGQKHCVPAGNIASGGSGGTGEMSEKVRRDRSRIPGCFGTEGAALLDTWLPPTCKEGTARGGDKGAACKGVSAVRRHAGGLYDAGSYCYTLVKCLKPFVRNEKGVIEANDYTQGSPINSEPLVMKRTHCNEKRAPKVTADLSVFSLLSIFLISVLCC